MYVDSKDQKTEHLIKADKSVYYLKLKKECNLENKKHYYSNYYSNDTNTLLEIAEEIASFCSHFKEVYHTISYNYKSIEISFYIYSELDSNDINEEKATIINKRSKQNIINNVHKFSRKFSNELTRSFKDNMLEKGNFKFKIIAFNIDNLSKSVINTNYKRINSIISDSGRYMPSNLHKVEFRKINNDDIKKLNNLEGEEKVSPEEYIGLNAVIIEIDYDNWFDSVKKHFEDNFEKYRDSSISRIAWEIDE